MLSRRYAETAYAGSAVVLMQIVHADHRVGAEEVEKVSRATTCRRLNASRAPESEVMKLERKRCHGVGCLGEELRVKLFAHAVFGRDGGAIPSVLENRLHPLLNERNLFVGGADGVENVADRNNATFLDGFDFNRETSLVLVENVLPLVVLEREALVKVDVAIFPHVVQILQAEEFADEVLNQKSL